MWARGLYAFEAVSSSTVAAWPLATKMQPFLLVKAIDTLMIDLPAFAAKQTIDALVAVANPGHCNLSNAGHERLIVAWSGVISVSRSGQHNNTACSAYGHPVLFDEMLRKLAPLRWPHSFFLMTS